MALTHIVPKDQACIWAFPRLLLRGRKASKGMNWALLNSVGLSSSGILSLCRSSFLRGQKHRIFLDYSFMSTIMFAPLTPVQKVITAVRKGAKQISLALPFRWSSEMVCYLWKDTKGNCRKISIGSTENTGRETLTVDAWKLLSSLPE